MAGTFGVGEFWTAGSGLWNGVGPFSQEVLTQIGPQASALAASGLVVSGLGDLFGAKPTVGVCIGAASAKVVEIKRTGKGWELSRFGLSVLPEDSVVNREVFNPVAVTESIRAALNQAKITQKNVVTGMGGAAVILKRMTVEVQKASEIQDAVFWEAEQYLPFDPSEVSMDYHLISRGKDNRADALFVAAKLSVMDGFVSSIAGAGLKVKVFDTESFALQNVFEANYDARPGEAVAIVDIGASTLKLLVVHDGVPVFTKESPMGGRNLTAEIQRQMNLSAADAEALKITQNRGAVPQEIAEITQVAIENFGTEIRRALDFYNASSSGAPVSYVLLTGGSSQIPELSKGVEERVGLPTQLLNPFARIGYDTKVFSPELIASIAPVVTVPLGYALRGATG